MRERLRGERERELWLRSLNNPEALSQANIVNHASQLYQQLVEGCVEKDGTQLVSLSIPTFLLRRRALGLSRLLQVITSK